MPVLTRLLRPPRRRPALPAFLHLLSLGTFFIGTDVFVIAGMLPDISGSLDVGMPAAGQLMTVFSLGYAILGPVLSTALAERAPRTVLTGALAAVALGNLVCASAPSLAMALLGRLLVAAGACQFTPFVATLASASVPENLRGRALARVNGGLVAGSVVGVPLGTWAGSAASWRMSLTVLALGTALVAAGLWRGLRGPVPHPDPVGTRARLTALRSPQIRTVLTITAFAVIAEYSVLTYAGAVFARATDHRGGQLALLFLLFGLGGLVGNAAAGALLDHPWGRHLVLVSLAGMTAAFLAMPWAAAHLVTALPCMALWGVFGWMYATPQQHRLISLAGQAAPLAVSVNSSLIYVGGAAGGALGGLLLANLPDRWSPVPAALFCALAVLPELRFRMRAKPRTTTFPRTTAP